MNQSVNVDDLVNDGGVDDLEVCEKCNVAVVEGMCNCAAEAKAQEEQDAKGNPEKEETPKNVWEALADIPGAPSREQIEVWKKSYHAVYALPFSDKDIYLWRPLIHQEFQMLMSNQELVAKEQVLQRTLVKKALLWPKLNPEAEASSRAGLFSTLYGVIMQGSWFLPPELAIALVEEL